MPDRGVRVRRRRPATAAPDEHRLIVYRGQSVLCRARRCDTHGRHPVVSHASIGWILHASLQRGHELLRHLGRMPERPVRGLLIVRVHRRNVLLSELRAVDRHEGRSHRCECLLPAICESVVPLPVHGRRCEQSEGLFAGLTRTRGSSACATRCWKVLLEHRQRFETFDSSHHESIRGAQGRPCRA